MRELADAQRRKANVGAKGKAGGGAPPGNAEWSDEFEEKWIADVHKLAGLQEFQLQFSWDIFRTWDTIGKDMGYPEQVAGG